MRFKDYFCNICISFLLLFGSCHANRRYGPNPIYPEVFNHRSRQSNYGLSHKYGPVNKASSSCYDSHNRSIKCNPEFVNAAYNAPIEATNTCGINGPSQYCVQTGASSSNNKTCEVCDARVPGLSHPPTHMIDAKERHETWWQSESLFEGQWPKQVNITLHLGKAFEISYVRLKFFSPRAESFAIYKRVSENDTWVPFQYYSSTCLKRYNVSNRAYASNEDETQALCTKEFSDLSPLTGGNVVFTTLEGRPNVANIENNERLQNFITATDIRIVLDNMNTFGDEIFGDEQVLRSYYYAISDLSVGGICKCNGHASRCIAPNTYGPIDPNGRRRLVCQCEHNTAGPDCSECLPLFNDQPWRPSTSKKGFACQPCNCNGRSNKCFFDEALWHKTGHGGHCIDCSDNTDGPNCDKCKENYYLDKNTNKCTTCSCDPIGSVSLQCIGTGQCACKSGVEGKKCDRCAANYFDFGHLGCRPCGCNAAGSLNNIPSCNNTGKCMCKKNVEGEKCDRCKPGYFDLQTSNPLGCLSCFCYGHSDECSSTSGYSPYRIESNFNRDSERWVAKDKEGNNMQFQYNSMEHNIATFSIYQDKPVYFYAPEKFLNDKKYAYNRNLSFSLKINDNQALTTMDDIVIEGNGIRISSPIFAQGNLVPSRSRQVYSFRLNEDVAYGWTPILSPRDFISLLSNITAIKIKATYSKSGTGSIDDVSLETAISHSGSDEQATWVETCTCPKGYDGQHCDSCAAGYKHDPPRGGKFAKCVPCNCNKHGEYCDSESGRCICNHNTAGDTCDRCAPGYYGNALQGTEDDCTLCPCPNGGECTILPDETVACLQCPEGYGGRLCDMCVDGYAMNKGSCEKCECNGNIDPNAIGNCNLTTGECIKCIFNTWGRDCEKCLPGYFGSALAFPKGDCQPCGCDLFGTYPEENFNEFNEAQRYGYLRSYFSTSNFFTCNSISGQCRCKPNVAGKQCNVCMDGYWDLNSNEGCKACNCDPVGSVDRSCDNNSGQCKCKPGVTGKLCDQCMPDYYGFGSEGCTKCECDKIGSSESQCDLITGQCKCRPNVEGKHCEFCQENKYNKEAGCIDCPPCYTLVQEAVAAHRVKVSNLKTLLDDIEQNPHAVEDSNFERQLNEMLTNVNQLLNEAKTTQGVDGSLIYQLEQIKDRIKKVQETAKKIDSQLNFINTQINYGSANISNANQIISNAENDLDNARNYLENEGRQSLKKAKRRFSNYGQQSEKMSEIAREARILADEYENKAKIIIDTHNDARNTSETAYNLAKDAINTQKANKEELEKLKDKLKEVKDQHHMTVKLSEDVHKDATKAEQESLALFTEVSNIKLPELDSTRYKADAISIIAQVKAAYNETNEILNRHQDLLNSTNSQLKDVKALYKEAERQQKITDNLLAETDLALNQANDAIQVGENILTEAKKTLKTLKDFDEIVQKSKGKATEALSRVPEIQKNIDNAIEKSNNVTRELNSALTEAINARDIAKNAETNAQHASKDSQKIRTEAQQTKKKVDDLNKKLNKLLQEVELTSNKMKTLEDQAAKDEKMVQNALEMANTAKTSALDSIHKVKNSTKTVDDILRNLNGMDDMDEKYLFDLEQKLRDAEIELKSADLDARVANLEKLNEEQKNWIHNYEDEVNKLAADVANIGKIRESLPDGCFRRYHLEP